MSTMTQTHEATKDSPFREVMGNRNFRLLWIGEGVSVLGDHFYMIALPWLVLQLTGDSLAMGTVLALAAVPRALLMLVGGALTDRFSPRSLMLASNAIQLRKPGCEIGDNQCYRLGGRDNKGEFNAFFRRTPERKAECALAIEKISAVEACR